MRYVASPVICASCSRTRNDNEAPIVRRIYSEYLEDCGLKQIAHRLNDEGVRAPSAGRRGSGSSAPGAVRTILLNARYRGFYLHGRSRSFARAEESPA